MKCDWCEHSTEYDSDSDYDDGEVSNCSERGCNIKVCRGCMVTIKLFGFEDAVCNFCALRLYKYLKEYF